MGGIGGALAALLGMPKAQPAPPSAPPVATQARSEPASAPAETIAAAASGPIPAATEAAAPGLSAAVAAPSASVAPPEPSAPSTAGIRSAPPLEPVTTNDALMKAMMLCDRKQDVDECERAALALEKGSAGPADADQAKRFRRIALTHLVAQCETAVPHACFVLAAKYRAGTELPANVASAEVLEKRGLSLCRLRSAPECPAAP